MNIEKQSKEDQIKELIKKYKLSEEEHNKIYELIKEIYLRNAKISKNPISIIVGAQPGSGKGSLIGYSKKYFENSNDVFIISTDDYKPFHPKASEIAKLYPTEYSAVVEADSAKWTSKILQEAILNRYSFIFEVTLKNTRILERMKELKENGFEVMVRAMSVPYIESLLSAYERYEKQVESRSWGRFFDPLSYNYIYENIPNTIEEIEQSKYCDALEIYKRGVDIKAPELIYASYKNDYKEKHEILSKDFEYKTAKEAMIINRNKETEDIKETINERVKSLERNLENRETTDEEKEALKILKELINNY